MIILGTPERSDTKPDDKHTQIIVSSEENTALKRPGKSTKRVTIISRESDEPTLDIRMLRDELKGRGVEVRTLSRLLTKDVSVKNAGYIGHLIKQAVSMLSSDVIVLDTYCIPVSMLPHRKKLRTVQMWHALSAVKKFGWQTVGKKDGSSEKVANLMKMHRGYDYVVCCSDVTAEHFCEAFRVRRGKIVKLGLPRIDYIKSVSGGGLREQKRGRILARYPQLADQNKKNILYAPTFHRGGPADVKGLAEAIDPDKYNIVVKLHPIDRKSGDRVTADNVIYDEDFDTYDMLAAADIVISDYSSFVVESSLAGKPLYLYTYDIGTYSETTGLNMDLEKEAIAACVFREAGALAAALDEPYDFEALSAFRDKYIDIDTNSCTADLADFIEEL